jgi:hypothetical protein
VKTLLRADDAHVARVDHREVGEQAVFEVRTGGDRYAIAASLALSAEGGGSRHR